MTGFDIGKAIGDAIAGMLIIVGCVCAALGALVVWGLPKLWALLKPLIHSLTA